MRLDVCTECHPVCGDGFLFVSLSSYTNENLKAEKAFI